MEALRGSRVIRHPTVAETVVRRGNRAIRRLIGGDTVTRLDRVRRRTSRLGVRARSTVRLEVRRPNPALHALAGRLHTALRRLTAAPDRRIPRLPLGAAAAVWAAAHRRSAVHLPMEEAAVALAEVGAVVVRVTVAEAEEAAVDRRAAVTADAVSAKSILRKERRPVVGGVFVLPLSTYGYIRRQPT